MTLIVLNPITSLATEKDRVPSSYGNHGKKQNYGVRSLTQEVKESREISGEMKGGIQERQGP